MTPGHREELIEQVVSAARAADPRGGVRPSPAFYDLDDAGRVEAFELTMKQRRIEAAIDQQGHNATVKAVLAKLV
ncbi:MAG: hypothetical protein HOV80_39600 [Polyangiaceae bacterium]|nr:hypothetical protein [Polyangiaceae bacterium]